MLITECLFISACVFDPSITLSLQSVVRAQKMALWMTKTKRIKGLGELVRQERDFLEKNERKDVR